MTQWLSEWWRFLVLAVVVGAINLVIVRFLPDYLAAGTATFFNFIVGGNMIFDLINRSAWQRKVQEQAEQISDRDRTIEARDREIAARDREIADHNRENADHNREIAARDREIAARDREIAARDREIADLRRQVEERSNGKDAA